MASILDLSPDLLVTVIPQYLLPEETFEFSILNKALYDIFYNSSLTTSLYKIYYNKKFTNNSQDFQLINEVDLNWITLFKSRVNLNQKVYTWGSNERGRLGYLINQLPNASQLINGTGMGSFGVHTATNMVQFNHNIVIDIIANGFSFVLLTNRGDMYYTGSSWKRSEYSAPGPFEKRDYQPPPVISFDQFYNQAIPHRRSLRPVSGGFSLPFTRRFDRDVTTSDEPVGSRRRLPTNPNLTLPPEQQTTIPELRKNQPSASPKRDEIESNFITRLEIPTNDAVKIVSICTGREHILALDSQNNLYTWDSGTNNTTGVKLVLPNFDKQKHTISKIVAGWQMSGCYISGVGIVIWFGREVVTKEAYESGEDVSVKVHSFAIPGTASHVTDFVIGDGYVLYLKSGRLYKLSGINVGHLARLAGSGQPIPYDELFMGMSPMDNFNDWLDKYNTDHDTFSSFVKLNNCFYSFAVLTNDDQVLFGEREHMQDEAKEAPIVIPELQNKNIKSIEIGDYHYLALTKAGNVLSWGLESRNCGCLGLGNADNFVSASSAGTVQDLGHGRGIRVLQPVQIINPPYAGKWVNLTARGWHSGGIYIATEDSDVSHDAESITTSREE